MPIYDYVCTSCGHEMEVIHSVAGHGPSACPKCGGHMRKAIVAAAVHFKGSGWARKERGAARPSKPASSESSPSSGDASAPPKESSGSSSEKSGDNSGEKSSETAPKGAD